MLLAHSTQIILHVHESLSYLEELDPPMRTIVRNSYMDATHVAFWLSGLLAFGAFASAVFIREKALNR